MYMFLCICSFVHMDESFICIWDSSCTDSDLLCIVDLILTKKGKMFEVFSDNIVRDIISSFT